METMWRKALLIGRWLLPYIRNAAPVTLVLGVVALLVATWWLGPRLEIHGEYPLMAWQMRALVPRGFRVLGVLGHGPGSPVGQGQQGQGRRTAGTGRSCPAYGASAAAFAGPPVTGPEEQPAGPQGALPLALVPGDGAGRCRQNQPDSAGRAD